LFLTKLTREYINSKDNISNTESRVKDFKFDIVMSVSNNECQKYIMEGKAWGSYSESENSTSGFSNICNSPMEYSNKMDDTSSLCSSNDSSSNDQITLPKPPPSLGRRRQRRLCSQTMEVFEFSDLIVDTVPLKPDCQTIITDQAPVENHNSSNEDNQAPKDRYAALRNIEVNDNEPCETFQPPIDLPRDKPSFKPNNPFLTHPLDNCQSKSTIQTDLVSNHDKYAAFSEAIAISQKTGDEISGSMKWSRSVMGQGDYGWSEQVLHGSADS